MEDELIFSWAWDSKHEFIHVSKVERGKACGCVCPNCLEPLIARKGDVKAHGFAHHSENRQSNLEICYKVILYKLAEYIIRTKKCIHAPSYYGIIKESDIKFVGEVKVDSKFEREDKQPDVIATGKDGKLYLIEFVFSEKIQHRQPIDYKNMTCLEIDLSNQTLDNLEEFLLKKSEGRRWLNNTNYFESIEARYRKQNKNVRIIDEEECKSCELYQQCCAIKIPYTSMPIVIEESGRKYRICKPELYEKDLKELRQRKAEEERRRKEYEEMQARLQAERKKFEEERAKQRKLAEERWIKEQEEKREQMLKRQAELSSQKQDAESEGSKHDHSERTCFDCANNLLWASKNGYAHCGCPNIMGVPSATPPETARKCMGFRRK